MTGGWDGFAEANKDELKALAEAVVESNGAKVVAGGAALVVKCMTGSSIAAGAAEKAAAKAVRHLLANNPTARLKQAAEAFLESDRKQNDLLAFATLVTPLLDDALELVSASVGRTESAQGAQRQLHFLKRRQLYFPIGLVFLR